jgi:hypothetical protein
MKVSRGRTSPLSFSNTASSDKQLLQEKLSAENKARAEELRKVREEAHSAREAASVFLLPFVHNPQPFYKLSLARPQLLLKSAHLRRFPLNILPLALLFLRRLFSLELLLVLLDQRSDNRGIVAVWILSEVSRKHRWVFAAVDRLSQYLLFTLAARKVVLWQCRCSQPRVLPDLAIDT